MSDLNYASYRALWSAVMVAAIRDMDSHLEIVRTESRRYIFSSSKKPTSMRWICEMLGLDSEAVQAACTSRVRRMQLADKKATRGGPR